MTADHANVGVTARLRVDLGALEANYRTLCKAALPGRCGAVVKADAYGLGVDAVVARLLGAGCEAFFVATFDEGLRVGGLAPDAAVFVFAGADQESARPLADAGLVPMLNSTEQLEAWRGLGHPAAIHLDTGMGRLGFVCADVDPAAFAGVDVALLATHLACADEPEHALTAQQLARFAEVTARFPGVPTSLGNSAGTLTGGALRGDLCRPGIALYGGNPFIDRPNPMRSVVTLEARVLQTRALDADSTVGYGASHTMKRPGVIATLGVGYADGLLRSLSNRGQVSIGRRRAPIVGRVSMDLITVDVTGIDPAPAAGDWVEILGADIGIDECAGWAGTIGYEILTGLGARAQRRYIE